MGRTYGGRTEIDRLNKCKRIARQRGGECLSDRYVNTQTRMHWRCANNHEWKAILANVVYKNKWCPACAGNKRLQINDAVRLATTRGGSCLSTEYKNASSKLKWKCQHGHEWQASYNNVRGGSWCPYCVGLFGETVVRLFLEEYFQKPFVKIRPAWLGNLELDGYCENIGVAFEYNGPQHHDINHKFYTEQLKNRDNKKRILCRQRGITLIDIPYINKNDLVLFKSVIMEILQQNGFEKRNVEINIKDVYPSQIVECKGLAKKNGGECLSEVYLGCDRKLRWKCACGNEWETTMYVIKTGHWCPRCGNKKKRSPNRHRAIWD